MHAPLDLVISGGTVYAPDGTITGGQIRIRDGKIVSVEQESDWSVQADRHIDATGLDVLPGAIDTHSHHRDPGFTHKEDITTATTAAALGGITTSIGMPNVDPPTTTPQRYADLIDSQQNRAVVDFNHHPAPTRLEHVAELASMGALGFKVYMVVDSKRSYPHMPGLGVHEHGDLLKICEAVADAGRVLMVHPNDQSLLHVLEERAWASEDYSFANYAYAEAALDGVVWNVAVAVLLELQRATSVPLHVLHMMGPGMIRLIQNARHDGGNVTSEVNPFALFLSDLDAIRHLGPLALGRCIPPGWLDALYRAISDGTIDVLGSDHAPHALAEKQVGWENMWKAPSGTPQLQHYLPRLLTETIAGRLRIEDVVRITATNPALRFGLHPRKGTLIPGADADVTIVDMRASVPVRDDNIASKAGYSPYAGTELFGMPVYTLVRGTVVADHGEIKVSPGFGKFTPPVSAPAPASTLARHAARLESG
ncbi:MAG TPA: dihydroorotase family protein [Streptosporangiaceae bacterium]|nr:dihydroorotase family protein [Streptosporangiaceae bacterium]